MYRLIYFCTFLFLFTGGAPLWATLEAQDASDTLSCPLTAPSPLSKELEEQLIFLEKAFIKKGGPQKAFTHFKNILKFWFDATYEVKQFPAGPIKHLTTDDATELHERVNQLEDGKPFLQIQNRRYALISDMTQLSSNRRLWLLNLDGKDKQAVRAFYTTHGRGPRALTPHYRKKTRGSNVVKKMTHEGNDFGSLLTPTGLHITGSVYQGANRGPEGKDLSLILHGVEEGVNDNSTERLVVIHSQKDIYECDRNGTQKEGAHIMSSGCTMVDTKVVNDIILKIRGTGGVHPDFAHEPKTGGAIYFVYGHRESQLPDSFYAIPGRLQE